MDIRTLKRPVGMDNLCDEIEEICRNAHIYRYTGKPNHLVINLDAGEGRTTVARYITDMFRLNKVLSFSSGLTDYIELSFDGTREQMESVFRDVRKTACYENNRKEPTFFCCSEMAANSNQVQYKEMLDNLKNVCRHAFVVFFTSAVPSEKEEKLISKIMEIDDVKRIQLEPYSTDCLALIAGEVITGDYDMDIENEDIFHRAMVRMLGNATTVKETKTVVNSMIKLADYSARTPVITNKMLTKIVGGKLK